MQYTIIQSTPVTFLITGQNTTTGSVETHPFEELSLTTRVIIYCIVLLLTLTITVICLGLLALACYRVCRCRSIQHDRYGGGGGGGGGAIPDHVMLHTITADLPCLYIIPA